MGNYKIDKKSKRDAIHIINGYNIAVLVVFIMITFFLGLNLNKLLFLPICASTIMIITLFLTSKGFFRLSKYILIIVPSYTILTISSIAKSNGFTDNVLMYLVPKILIYALLISPVVFFGIRKKKDLIISVIIMLPAIVFYEKVHSLFGVEIQDLSFDPTYYTIVFVLLTIFFIGIYSSILSLQSFNLKNIHELKQSQEIIKRKKSILEIQNIELEFNSHLFSILQITSQSKKSLNLILKEVLSEFLSIEKLGLDGKGVVFLKNEEGNLVLVAEENAKALQDSCQLVKSGQCLCGKVLSKKESLFCNEINHSHDILPVGMKPHGHYVVPIMDNGEVLGVFNVYIKAGEEKSEIIENYLNATSSILARRIISENYLNKIENQKSVITTAMKEVTDSLSYATNLQSALLPNQTTLDNIFNQSYFIYLPKDMVSGDFYFAYDFPKYKYFGIGDCTGHGIPGAILSAMSIETVNQVIQSDNIASPELLLEELRLMAKLRFATNKDTNRNDAMDMALCRYEENNKELLFSGANINLVIIRNGEIFEYKSTRNPIGNYLKEVPFNVHKIVLEKGDNLYIYSDGLSDQFGFSFERQKQIKLMRKRVYAILLAIQKLPFEKQKAQILSELYTWKKDIENTDDITLFTLRIG